MEKKSDSETISISSIQVNTQTNNFINSINNNLGTSPKTGNINGGNSAVKQNSDESLPSSFSCSQLTRTTSFITKKNFGMTKNIQYINILRRLGYFQEAEDLFKTYVIQMETNLSPFLNLSGYLSSQNKPQYDSAVITGLVPSITNIDNLVVASKIYFDKEAYKESELILRDLSKTVPTSHPVRLKITRLLCKSLEYQGKKKEAEQSLQQFCTEIEEYIATMEKKAEQCMLEEKMALSQQLFKETIEVKEKFLIPTLEYLVELYKRIQSTETVIATLKQILDLRSKLNDPDNISLCDTLHHLSDIYISQGRIDEAEKVLIRSIRIAEKTLQTTENVAKGVPVRPTPSGFASIGLASSKLFHLRIILMSALTRFISLMEDNPSFVPAVCHNSNISHNNYLFKLREQFHSLLPDE